MGKELLNTRLLTQFANPDLVRRWKGLEKKLSQTDHVTIANTGLYSAGKSSLFNALLDQVDHERFQTGAIPTTKTGDREHWNQHIDILDTPGIDVNEQDDKTGFRAITESDIIMVLHNVKIGPLNRAEYDWLKKIASAISPAERAKRLIFVCTWIDERERDGGYEALIQEIQRQVAEAVGCKIAFEKISAKRYFAGRRKGNQALTEKSGIPALRKLVLRTADAYYENLGKQRQEEKERLCKEIWKSLQMQRTTLTQKKEKITRDVSQKYKQPLETWKNTLGYFTSSRDRAKKTEKASDEKNLRLKDIQGEFNKCSSQYDYESLTRKLQEKSNSIEANSIEAIRAIFETINKH